MEAKKLSLSMKDLMPLIEEKLQSGNEVMLTVQGVSMDPYLVDRRDTVCFAPLGDRELKKGDIVLFRRQDGSVAMHRILRIRQDGSFDIVGDNQAVCDTGITRDMLIAFVPHVVRKGKEMSTEKGFWRFAMIQYMNVRVKHPKFAFRLMRTIGKIHGRLKG